MKIRFLFLSLWLFAAPLLHAGFVIFNTSTQEIHRSERPDRYTVFGQPGVLESPLVELEVIRQEFPALGLNERANSTRTVNLVAKTITYEWTVETYTPTAEELDDRAMRADLENLRSLYTALKNGTATAQQQRNVLAWLLKDAAKRHGLIAQ